MNLYVVDQRSTTEPCPSACLCLSVPTTHITSPHTPSLSFSHKTFPLPHHEFGVQGGEELPKMPSLALNCSVVQLWHELLILLTWPPAAPWPAPTLKCLTLWDSELLNFITQIFICL